MTAVGSVTSSPSTALTLLQVDTSVKPRSAQEEAETDPVSLSAVTALQVLDPRSALTLSTQASDAILSVLHKHPRHAGNVHLVGGIDESAMLTDEVFAQTIADTPAHYTEVMKGLGATRWVWRPESHLTGIDFFKGLSRAIPRDYKNPIRCRMPCSWRRPPKSWMRSTRRAPRSCRGITTCTMTRTNTSELSGGPSAIPPISKPSKPRTPALHIAPVFFGNDAVLVIWPEASAGVIGLESLRRLRHRFG